MKEKVVGSLDKFLPSNIPIEKVVKHAKYGDKIGSETVKCPNRNCNGTLTLPSIHRNYVWCLKCKVIVYLE